MIEETEIILCSNKTNINNFIKKKDYLLNSCKILYVFESENTSIQLTNFPNSILNLSCCNFDIKKIHLPYKLTSLICYNNNLKKIKLSKNLLHLDCSNNMLKKLILPKNIISLDCSNNNLYDLKIRKNVKFLNCSYNNNPFIYRINSNCYMDEIITNSKEWRKKKYKQFAKKITICDKNIN